MHRDNNSDESAGAMLHKLSQMRKVVNHPKQIVLKRDENRQKELNRIQELQSSGAEFYRFNNALAAPQIGSAAYKAEEELRNLHGESLIASCGKLRMLDRLLIRLKAQGSRCLLFSQYTVTLDVLEEYLTFRFGRRDQVYFRLDGSTNRIMRELNTRAFNDPEMHDKLFIYMISTKAGGMGINLATADTVILYDSSWNPQVDLQGENIKLR